ncbi:uncharacterized protein LOC131429335 [Malaya genurostris]|uniref:uncharacterized protein LOC131429335 n=1 Tax=Malaya genurostris TaxID=325434 RepID=UPI0026F3D5BB|nr:uncharacterized protein LOC131429335 [Malaya genurostris]
MFLLTFALISVLVYLGLRYVYSYWERNGVPNLKPNIPFGNLITVAKKTESFGIAINSLYSKSEERLVGIYLFFTPAILIRDPYLAHQIMTEDFNHFHDRGVYCNEKGDPFSAHLFALPGKRWRNLRNKFTPTFTSGQLRTMLPTIVSIGDKLRKHLEPFADQGEVVNVRTVVSLFMQEIVATVFFGYEANCLNDPEDLFGTTLGHILRDTFSVNFRTAATFICPALLKFTGVGSLPPELSKFVMKVIKEQIEHREKNDVTRKDFVQLLINLRQNDTKNKEIQMSLGECAANIFLFYIAGSETSSGVISFTLHELSHNPEVLQKLVSEINEALAKSNGDINYDMVKEIKYLDLCVKETLRKYPTLPILNRECTQDYRVPDSKIVIRKGTQVVIPLRAYGMSGKYFPDPDRYQPERFDMATKNYDERAYYPFGEGPRNCIGLRMGEMVSKIGIIFLLSNFNFEATRGPEIEFSPAVTPLVPKHGILLRVTNRQKDRKKLIVFRPTTCQIYIIVINYLIRNALPAYRFGPQLQYTRQSRKMFLLTLALLSVLVYLGLRYVYSYWERNGIPNLKPNIPFGNLTTVAKKTESFGIAINSLYSKSKERLVGIYLFFTPAILIRDPYLAHQIMTEDFNHFHDRGVYCNEKGDPFTANLFGLPGKRWRNLRNKLTPTFTSGQLRNMLPTIMSVGHKLRKHLEPFADKGEIVNVRAVLSLFMQEIVATVFFGYEANCLNDPADLFGTTINHFLRDNFSINFRTAASFVCPALLKFTGISALPPEVSNFVMKVIKEQIEYREKNEVTRKDFIQLLIDLRQTESSNEKIQLSLTECAANIFLFYIAGSETSSGVMSFTLHELSHNPEVTGKLVAEIDDVLNKSNGDINFDSIKQMKYLDLCVKETLRKYPGLPILNRECTEDYRVPDSKIVIRKGTQVVIPLRAYGMSEEYFPDPERYHPERFDVATKNYDERAYYPFGEGPRNCIGLRMGEMVTKIGLIFFLSNFNFEATKGPELEFSPAVVPLMPKDGTRLRLTRRFK